MNDCFETLSFYRHKRPLRALLLESQVWFCIKDLGRLMGAGMNERMIQKLDPDQRKSVWLSCTGHKREAVIVSESGAFALFIYHYVPENRALRQWLAHEVIPMARQAEQGLLGHEPKRLIY